MLPMVTDMFIQCRNVRSFAAEGTEILSQSSGAGCRQETQNPAVRTEVGFSLRSPQLRHGCASLQGERACAARHRLSPGAQEGEIWPRADLSWAVCKDSAE